MDDDSEYEYSEEEDDYVLEDDDDMEWDAMAQGSENPNAPPTCTTVGT